MDKNNLVGELASVLNPKPLHPINLNCITDTS